MNASNLRRAVSEKSSPRGVIIGKGASSTDILRWDFSVMGAKSYLLNLSENVRRSLEYKRRNGEWGGKAPLGYLNQRDGNNKSTPRAIARSNHRSQFSIRRSTIRENSRSLS